MDLPHDRSTRPPSSVRRESGHSPLLFVTHYFFFFYAHAYLGLSGPVKLTLNNSPWVTRYSIESVPGFQEWRFGFKKAFDHENAAISEHHAS